MNEQNETERARPSLLSVQMSLRKLHRQLATARAEDFFRLLWALDAVNDGRADAARTIIRDLPDDVAARTDSSREIHKWELETLATEYLVTPQEGPIGGRIRALVCNRFNTAANLVNALRDVENVEAGRYCSPEKIWMELARISQRQFHWQRGYINQANFYRSAYIYGQDGCAEYFRSAYGLSPNDLSVVGFSFNASTVRHPGFTGNWDLSRLGVTPQAFQAALRLIAAPIDSLRQLASRNRVGGRPIAYQASPLRQFPGVRFPMGIVFPLRDLLILRTTSGAYYDVVGAGGGVINEIAARFETYAAAFFETMMDGMDVQREYKYGPKKNRIATPDILLKRHGRCEILVECKATKLTLAAQYADDPIAEASRGYAELSKGIYQIWRFCAHARLGRVSDELAPDPVGLLLTLDPWAMMSADAHREIFAGASRLADEDSDILPVDHIPVAMSPIDDVEIVACRSTREGFAQTVRQAARTDFIAWLLPGVQDSLGLVGDDRPYPFHEQLGEVLPWWGVLKREAGRDE